MSQRKDSQTSKKSLCKPTQARESEHDYATPMEVANANSKRDRGDITPINTPEKIQMGKKAKGECGKGDSEETVGTILRALEALGTRVDNRLDEISSQLQQHSAMLASVAKTVQINSEDIEECKKKVKTLETQVDLLHKEKVGMKERLLSQERYKRKWCLRIKGKK